jgi:hypothetical protein
MKNGYYEVGPDKATEWVCSALPDESSRQTFKDMVKKGHYESAQTLLNHAMVNDRFVNRRIRDKRRRSYARDMERGNWTLSTVHFHENGELVDGFHRMMAIISSGATVKFYVIGGLNDKDVENIDTGIARTAGDTASRKHGIQNACLAMSICNLVYRAIYEAEPTLSDKLDLYFRYEKSIRWAISITFARVALKKSQVPASLALAHIIDSKKAEALGASLASMEGWIKGGIEQTMERTIQTEKTQSHGGGNIDLMKKLLRAIQLHFSGAKVFAKLQVGEEGLRWARSTIVTAESKHKKN